MLGLTILTLPTLVQAKNHKKTAHYSKSSTQAVQYTKQPSSQSSEIKCLADNIYHEAKGEGMLGWKAVGHVTMNRVKSGKFANNVCGVVYQKKQFSWVGKKKRASQSNYTYQEISELAKEIYNNHENMNDITKGSIYFHASYVKPRWKLTKRIRIGKHIFYS